MRAWLRECANPSDHSALTASPLALLSVALQQTGTVLQHGRPREVRTCVAGLWAALRPVLAHTARSCRARLTLTASPLQLRFLSTGCEDLLHTAPPLAADALPAVEAPDFGAKAKRGFASIQRELNAVLATLYSEDVAGGGSAPSVAQDVSGEWGRAGRLDALSALRTHVQVCLICLPVLMDCLV